MAAALLALHVAGGPSEPDTAQALADMEAMGRQLDAAEARMEAAAAALCRAEHGPGSTHVWTVDGHLVCHPSALPTWPRDQPVQLATGL